MNGRAVNVKAILFDLLVSIATFALAELFAILTAALIERDSEEALGLSLYIVVPFWTILFYLIRRRFSMRLTVIQILITTFTIFTLTYLFTILLKYIPDLVTYEKGYFLIPVFAMTILLLTKQITDLLILRKHSTV
jgi:hypothetical protein